MIDKNETEQSEAKQIETKDQMPLGHSLFNIFLLSTSIIAELFY
jgi:hypothetical protein